MRTPSYSPIDLHMGSLDLFIPAPNLIHRYPWYRFHCYRERYSSTLRSTPLWSLRLFLEHEHVFPGLNLSLATQDRQLYTVHRTFEVIQYCRRLKRCSYIWLLLRITPVSPFWAVLGRLSRFSDQAVCLVLARLTLFESLVAISSVGALALRSWPAFSCGCVCTASSYKVRTMRPDEAN